MLAKSCVSRQKNVSISSAADTPVEISRFFSVFLRRFEPSSDARTPKLVSSLGTKQFHVLGGKTKEII
jgi:hypothetical protein